MAHHHKTQINQSAIKITTLEIRAFARKLHVQEFFSIVDCCFSQNDLLLIGRKIGKNI